MYILRFALCVSLKMVGMELIPHDETLSTFPTCWDRTRQWLQLVWYGFHVLPSQVIHVYLTAAVHPSLFLIQLRQPANLRTSSALVACAFPRAITAMEMLIVMTDPTRMVVVCISFVYSIMIFLQQFVWVLSNCNSQYILRFCSFSRMVP